MLFSCGSNQDRVKEAEYQAPDHLMAKPVWFNGPERFRTLTRELDLQAHPFFDLDPFWLPKSSTVSYYLVSPKKSSFHYDFDLKTGRKYLSHQYCSQRDVWDRFKGSIKLPPFSEGIVPRLLDQTGRPQHIWVFGDQKYFKEKEKNEVFSQRTRIVGGMVVQYCQFYPCDNDTWESRLFLIGVNPLDPKYTNVTKLPELRKKENWNYVRAYVENYRGRKILSSRELPAYRIVGEVNAIAAGRYAFKRGFLFSMKSINLLRKQCYKLYDYIWDNMEKVRNYKPKEVQKEKNKKIIENNTNFFYKNKIGSNVISEDVDTLKEMEESKSLDRKVDFENDSVRFFTDLFNRYERPLNTCFKYVQASNINFDKNRHWTFAFLENFINLQRMDQTYRCLNKVWVNNPEQKSGGRYYDKSLKTCSVDGINKSMERGINRMAVLRKRGVDHYRYIEYDSGVGGSHEKIYSWVRNSGKDQSCRSVTKKDKIIEEQIVKLRKEIFPLDVSWKAFEGTTKSNESLIMR